MEKKIWLPIAGILILGVILIALCSYTPTTKDDGNYTLRKFNSEKELRDFLKDNKIERSFYNRGMGILESTTADFAFSSGASKSASDYSTTNIQVEGVDEADIIKNDGKYIYITSYQQKKVFIVNAYPAEEMEIINEIEFDTQTPTEIYINDDKLIVFTTESYILEEQKACFLPEGCRGQYRIPSTKILVYDMSDKEDIELENEVSMSGYYFNSRMIGDYVYLVTNEYVYDTYPTLRVNSEEYDIDAGDIYYQDVQDYGFQYTNLLSINIQNGEVEKETVLTGQSQEMYVSQDNMYLVKTVYPYWHSPANMVEEGELKEQEKTIVQKISIDDGEFEIGEMGGVPGRILNQFSMDEFEGNFRIATTTGNVWDENEKSTNNLYILDEDMDETGSIEGLAPGERIYSVRFMGERGYIVTFKKVDPLFVLDLSDPEDPEVLGKLKIPGYSDYLHPIDENHILGIGKDTVEAEDQLKEQRDLDFAWYQGVKIAIFDITDVENPIEKHKVIIGDRGIDSEVLRNHKVFLFDTERELMVLPITLAEIQGEKTVDNQYGDITYQGAYVYKVNTEDGFELQGRITHYEDDEVKDKAGYYWRGDRDVRRSLYMDNVLYTISEEMLKANDLSDELEELNNVVLV